MLLFCAMVMSWGLKWVGDLIGGSCEELVVVLKLMCVRVWIDEG